jgi:hypothetical protein
MFVYTLKKGASRMHWHLFYPWPPEKAAEAVRPY